MELSKRMRCDKISGISDGRRMGKVERENVEEIYIKLYQREEKERY